MTIRNVKYFKIRAHTRQVLNGHVCQHGTTTDVKIHHKFAAKCQRFNRIVSQLKAIGQIKCF